MSYKHLSDKWHEKPIVRAMLIATLVAVVVAVTLRTIMIFLDNDLAAAVQLYEPWLDTLAPIVAIPIEYYRTVTRNKRRVETRLNEILTTIQDNLDISYQGEPEFFRIPDPKWIDFTNSTVYFREEIDELSKMLKPTLQQDPLALLVAPSGAGKTHLAYALAYVSLVDPRSPFEYVYYENVARRDSRLVSHTTGRGELVYRKLEDIFDEVLALLESNQTTPSRRVLVILDDIHLNIRIIEGLGRRLARYRNRVSVLLVARSLALQHQEQDEWKRRILGHTDADLSILHLDKRRFEQTLEGITSQFLTTNRFRADDPEKLLRVLSEQTGESLRLLSFILKDLPTHNRVIRHEDIGSLPLCKRVEGYFDKLRLDLIDQIQGSLIIQSQDSYVSVFSEVLMTLAIFSQMEVLIPGGAIQYLVEADKITTDAILNFLRHRREMRLVVENHTSLYGIDHPTVARTLVTCHNQKNPNSEYTKPEGLSKLERMCILLLKHNRNQSLPSPLPEILAFGQETTIHWDELNRFLSEAGPQGGADLVPHAMSKMGAGFHSCLRSLPDLLTSEAVIAEIVNSIQDGEHASEIIDSLLWMPDAKCKHILEIGAIVQAAASAIEESESPPLIVLAIKHHRPLVRSTIIQTAIATSIRKSDAPTYLIASIAGADDLTRNKEILEAVESRVDEIAIVIENSTNPWLTILLVSHMENVMLSEEIRYAIAKAIKESDKSWLILASLMNLEQVLADDRIRKAVAESIENSQRPERIVNLIKNAQSLLDDDTIRTGISGKPSRVMFDLGSQSLGSIPKKMKEMLIRGALGLFLSRAERLTGIEIKSNLADEMTSLMGDTEFQQAMMEIVQELDKNIGQGITPKTDMVSILRKMFTNERTRELIFKYIKSTDAPLPSPQDVDEDFTSPLLPAMFSSLLQSGIIWRVLEDFAELEDGFHEVALRGIPSIVQDIKTLEKPWIVAEAYRGYNAVLNDMRVQVAFSERAHDIAEEIGRQDNPKELIEVILEVDVLRQDSRIQKAIKGQGFDMEFS